MRHYLYAGFTIIELLMTISILSMLVAIAVPNLNSYFEKRHLIAAGEAIYGYLQLARAHAIATSADTYVDFEISGSTEWVAVISQTSGCNPDHAMVDSNPCYIIIDDGDGVLDSDDYVQYKVVSNDYTGVSVSNVTFGSDEAKFKYVRGTAKAGSVKLESESGYRLKVVTGLLGRIRMCSPSGDGHVAGYPTKSCSW